MKKKSETWNTWRFFTNGNTGKTTVYKNGKKISKDEARSYFQQYKHLALSK